MPLNELRLSELRDLAVTLTALEDVGSQMQTAGLDPVFDLTPGRGVRITTTFVMPGLAGEGGVTLPTMAARIVAMQRPVADSLARPDDGLMDRIMDAFRDIAPGPVPAEPEPADPSRSDDADGPSPTLAASEDQADSDGGQATAAVNTPPVATHVSEGTVYVGDTSKAPTPGSASAMAAQSLAWAGAWTEEQDALLIDALAQARIDGTPKGDVFRAMAEKLGRTFKAVEQRGYRLTARVNAEEHRKRAEAPESEPDTPSADAAAAHADEMADAAVQAADDLTSHLAALTDKGGWSLQRDTDLMELSIAGWPAGDIALELGMQDAAIKPRFDTLTGLHEDEATGKKVRRWTREQVLDGLKALALRRAA